MISQLQDQKTQALKDATTVLETMLRASGSDRRAHAFREWGCPPPMGTFIILHGLIIEHPQSSEARFLLVDDEGMVEQGWKYQASVVPNAGDWAVNWMKPQCTACFGQGVIDDAGLEICGVCGGEGWGVIGSRPFLYAEPALAASPA